jgi:ribosomal protein L9
MSISIYIFLFISYINKAYIYIYTRTALGEDTAVIEPGGEIRQTGSYKVFLKLHAKVDCSFEFDVVAETK